MSWEDDREVITQKYFELINLSNLELFGVIKEHLDESNQIFPIIKFILARVEVVLQLTISDKLWDAEIILRSAFETTIKFIFITTSTGEERDIKLEEYWDSLSKINSLKLSDQAKRNLRFFGDSQMHRFAYLPLILSEEKELELRQKWTKAERQKIEQKWSFTEMINQISKKNEGTGLEMILALGHGYRMSSHVIHGDETGIGIIDERESRTPEERDKAHRGHYLRLFSDALSICSLIGIETMAFLSLSEKRKFFFDNVAKLKEIEALEEKYKGKVFDDPDYDQYR
jgi:hypothetical protein